MAISFRRGAGQRGRVALALLITFGLLMVPACATPSQTIPGGGQAIKTGTSVGEMAPDFTLSDLDGNPLRLSNLRGKVVFLNFWATWCPPCRAEMPDIEALYQDYQAKDVAIIGVDILESVNMVRQFADQGGYHWTFVIDTTGEVANNYRVTVIPSSYFIDREGIIRAVSVGAMTKQGMEAQLARAMK